MSLDALRPLLDTLEITKKISQYWRVSVVEVTGSTQDDIAKRVSDGFARNGEVLVAEYQSAGRGRLDRKFEASASSALTFSFYIESQREKSEWGFIPLLAGLAVVYSLKECNPNCDISLKWPNDLLIADKKVGGIIAQVSSQGVIVGIGINVSMSQAELPVSHATSLYLQGCSQLDRNAILAAFLSTFEELFARWQSGEDLRHLYRESSATLGRTIKVELPGGAHVDGEAIDISAQGELIMKDGLHITVGDVIHLR
jgi:BirA family biotin operon repressor/biotin-[acetyl-CoA-carboxylase] ligase